MYQITKEQAQKEITASGNVCNYCGGKIEPIEAVDNARNKTFWIGCLACARFTSGCSTENYRIGKMLVEKYNFYYYKSDGIESDEYNKRCNIAKAIEIIEQIEHLKQAETKGR